MDAERLLLRWYAHRADPEAAALPQPLSPAAVQTLLERGYTAVPGGEPGDRYIVMLRPGTVGSNGRVRLDKRRASVMASAWIVGLYLWEGGVLLASRVFSLPELWVTGAIFAPLAVPLAMLSILTWKHRS